MAPRVLFRNSGLLVVFLVFFSSCADLPQKVKTGDALLTKEKGNYYYDGHLYTGVVEEYAGELLIAEFTISNGEKNGISKKWWPNGNLKWEAVFKDGNYHGEVKEFYENGNVYSVFHYVDGHESGLQQAWKSDGRIKVNYEVVNGRKYGLTGVKNCINAVEGSEHGF